MNIALGLGSLVLFAGVLAAVVQRSVRPVHALYVTGIAAVVGLITLAADAVASAHRSMAFFAFALLMTTTAAGVALAVAVVTRLPSRLRSSRSL
jgi:peptidoglycan/LPS O-acetylase OafA/YrhL